MRAVPIPAGQLGQRALTGCYPFRDHRTVEQLDARQLRRGERYAISEAWKA